MKKPTNNIGKQVGTKIKALRERRNLTQRQLANMLGRSVETISNFERGSVVTGLITLEKLGQIFEVPIRDFFDENLSESPNQPEPKSKHAAIVANAVELLPDEDLEIVAGVIGVLENQRRKSLKPSGLWRKKF